MVLEIYINNAHRKEIELPYKLTTMNEEGCCNRNIEHHNPYPHAICCELHGMYLQFFLGIESKVQTPSPQTLEEHESSQNHQYGVGIDIASFNILRSPKREKGPKKAGNKVKKHEGAALLYT